MHVSGARLGTLFDPQAGNHAGSLADVPLDGVQAKSAVREMSDSDVLAGGKQVDRLSRYQRGHGDLERPRHPHSAALVCSARVDIDHVESDAYRIVEQAGARPRLDILDDVLFRHAAARDDAPRFTNVRVLGQAIVRVHRVRPEAQFRIAAAFAIVARDVVLKPIEEGLGGLLGAL